MARWPSSSPTCLLMSQITPPKMLFLTSFMKLCKMPHRSTSLSFYCIRISVAFCCIHISLMLLTQHWNHVSSWNIFVDSCTNTNGRHLNLCGLKNLSIVDTWFPRENIHQWTWYSPDGRTRKALDHIIVTWHLRSFVTNTCVYRGAQLGNTDHCMLVGTFKLKLKLSWQHRIHGLLTRASLRILQSHPFTNAPSLTSSTPWQMQPDLTGNTSWKKSLSRSHARLDQLDANPRSLGYPVTHWRLLINVDLLCLSGNLAK